MIRVKRQEIGMFEASQWAQYDGRSTHAEQGRVTKLRRRKLAGICFAALTIVSSAVTYAEEEYEQFDPTEVAANVEAPWYVLIAYATIWLAVCIFLLKLWRRQTRLEQQLNAYRQENNDA